MIEAQDTPKEHKYILEFTHDEIDFIAACVHIVLQKHPKDEVIAGLLKSLRAQTAIVSDNPAQHGTRYKLQPPVTPQQVWGEVVGNIDLASYFQVISIEDI